MKANSMLLMAVLLHWIMLDCKIRVLLISSNFFLTHLLEPELSKLYDPLQVSGFRKSKKICLKMANVNCLGLFSNFLKIQGKDVSAFRADKNFSWKSWKSSL